MAKVASIEQVQEWIINGSKVMPVYEEKTNEIIGLRKAGLLDRIRTYFLSASRKNELSIQIASAIQHMRAKASAVNIVSETLVGDRTIRAFDDPLFSNGTFLYRLLKDRHMPLGVVENQYVREHSKSVNTASFQAIPKMEFRRLVQSKVEQHDLPDGVDNPVIPQEKDLSGWVAKRHIFTEIKEDGSTVVNENRGNFSFIIDHEGQRQKTSFPQTYKHIEHVCDDLNGKVLETKETDYELVSTNKAKTIATYSDANGNLRKFKLKDMVAAPTNLIHENENGDMTVWRIMSFNGQARWFKASFDSHGEHKKPLKEAHLTMVDKHFFTVDEAADDKVWRPCRSPFEYIEPKDKGRRGVQFSDTHEVVDGGMVLEEGAKLNTMNTMAKDATRAYNMRMRAVVADYRTELAELSVGLRRELSQLTRAQKALVAKAADPEFDVAVFADKLDDMGRHFGVNESNFNTSRDPSFAVRKDRVKELKAYIKEVDQYFEKGTPIETHGIAKDLEKMTLDKLKARRMTPEVAVNPRNTNVAHQNDVVTFINYYKERFEAKRVAASRIAEGVEAPPELQLSRYVRLLNEEYRGVMAKRFVGKTFRSFQRPISQAQLDMINATNLLAFNKEKLARLSALQSIMVEHAMKLDPSKDVRELLLPGEVDIDVIKEQLAELEVHVQENANRLITQEATRAASVMAPAEEEVDYTPMNFVPEASAIDDDFDGLDVRPRAASPSDMSDNPMYESSDEIVRSKPLNVQFADLGDQLDDSFRPRFAYQEVVHAEVHDSEGPYDRAYSPPRTPVAKVSGYDVLGGASNAVMNSDYESIPPAEDLYDVTSHPRVKKYGAKSPVPVSQVKSVPPPLASLDRPGQGAPAQKGEEFFVPLVS